MPLDPTVVHRHLKRLTQQRSLDAALEFFDALGYRYADDLPLPTRTWPDGVKDVVKSNAEPPLYLASHRDFQVIYTRLTTEHLARTVERPIVEQTLHKLHPYALFLFANEDLSLWDFVNVKYVAEDGARRRTIRRIHVGPTERLHTAAQRLAMLAVPAPETSALELQNLHDQAFDVEEVTRQFYRDYVAVFDALCKDMARRNPRRKDEAETEAQMLLDRLMFLYFIQKKGWLDGRRDYLHHRFQEYHQTRPGDTDFYGDFLLPLFVALSNEGLALPGLGEVPFLNGGLFEVPAEASVADQLVLGNAVFKTVFDDLLECYNFTVREDTPLDVEVAIDPEMLGQVFENLVLGLERGEDRRKATGSYYTPRVIVHFMCRQALKEYLAAESELDPERIEALMEAGPAEQLTPEEVAELTERITEPEARLLRALVEDARVLDPAVGSGAFLVGMLYEMVALSKLLDVRLYGQARVRRRNYDYDLKRGFIERNLYGVDIQPEAARICELRLWLSLMVEYERGRGEAVPTLPNLSYRVRVGDSLIERLFGEPVQLDELADDAVARQLVDRIQAEKRAYFQEPDLAEKGRRELHILGLLCELAAKLVGAKRGAVLQRRSAEVPGLFGQFGTGLLTDKQRKAKQEIEAELARYDALMERVKGVYERVGAMQDGRAPLEARDVGTLREELGLSFVWRLDFAGVFANKGGFDVVIGNPPYVRIQRIGTDDKAIYKQLYQSATGSYDLYVVFAERAWKLLAANGQFCFIQPNKFLKASYGKGLRKLLSEREAVKAIWDFGDSQIFGTATNYTCLLFLSKSDNRELLYVEIHDLDAWAATGNALEGMIPACELTDAEWNFVIGPGAPLYERLNQMPVKLGDVAHVFVGLQTSADPVFLFKDQEKADAETSMLYSEELDDYVEIESELLKSVVRSGSIGRYWAEPTALVLFPYFLEDGAFQLIPEREMRRSYPKAWDYLTANKKLLSGRERGKFRGPGWYQLYPKNLDLWEQPKIMLPYMITQLAAFYDEQDLYFVNVTTGGFGVTIGENYGNLKYMTGLLNSRLLDWFLRQVRSDFQSGYFAANKQFLVQLPIRTINSDNPSDAALHDRMVDLVEHMLALHHELPLADSESRADLEQKIAATDAEIDALVYELYGLTEEEIAIIEKAS